MAQVLSLDSTDRALLRALTANARASGSSLASTLGIAESTVSLRLRRLQTSGVIRRYRVDLNPLALGATVQALIAIRLVKHAREEIEAFRRAAPSLPGVLSLFHMARWRAQSGTAATGRSRRSLMRSRPAVVRGR